LEQVAEKRFGMVLERISRIVSIDPQPVDRKAAPQGPDRPSPLRLISAIQSASEPPVAAATSLPVSR
jgi:hypothetical protein